MNTQNDAGGIPRRRKGRRYGARHLSTWQIALRIVLIISVVELLIMFFVDELGDLSTHQVALLDTAILAVLTIPAIYWWVIKPFVEARDEALAKLEHLAHSDPLTHIANRRGIAECLTRLIHSCRRHGDIGALFVIDLDGFKGVNDRHGHEAGDAVLIAVAKRLRSMTRSEEEVGRLGGDEFVLLASRLGGDPEHARPRTERIAHRIAAVVETPIFFERSRLQVKASIGVFMLDSDAPDWEDAIAEADMAMYRAKQCRRKGVAFSDKTNRTGNAG